MTPATHVILCVDDDEQILRALIANLRARDYEVLAASTGEEALRLASERHPDAVILDLGLPGMSGIDVIYGLRGWTAIPILVLSARDGEEDKIAALDAGADDYISKPFGMGELLARLRASLRRATTAADGADTEAMIVTPHFVIDLAAKQITNDQGEIRLTPTEWGLVEVLVRNTGRLLTGRQLLQHVWGPAYGDETNYLRVHMAHIRRKLEPVPGQARYFITEAGIGYRFELAKQDTGKLP
jgi:two-component system, OmpR family, KDP operon response regulator KdpE